MDEEFYWYGINELLPDSTDKRGCYFYKKFGDKRIALSPIFNSYHAMKQWGIEAGFEDAAQFLDKKLNKWSNYVPFRVRLVPKQKKTGLATYHFLNPLKKTQKLILPPKIVEINNTPEIGLKDEYISVICGTITKV